MVQRPHASEFRRGARHVTIAGFMLGWLWYSPVLFAKAYMEELKSPRNR